MSIEKVADGIVSKYFKQPFQVGDTVKHPSGRQVRIISGQFMSNGRISNHWRYKEVLSDGSLSDTVESSYGWDV